MSEAAGEAVRRRWKRAREEGERATMSREGLRGWGCWVYGKMRKGEGRGEDGAVKMFRSSSKNLEGAAASVITSSIFPNLFLTPMLLFLLFALPLPRVSFYFITLPSIFINLLFKLRLNWTSSMG